MNVSEEKLLQSGFSDAELQKLRCYLVKNELTLDKVINELSKRFQAAFWLTVGMLLLYTVTLFFASKENIISLGIALLVALLITWFFQPPVLAYKSWAFRKKMLNG